MNPLMLLWLYRIGGALLLAGSLTAAYFGWAEHEQSLGAKPYIDLIAKQKEEAKKVLAIKTAEAETATKKWQDLKTQQETKDVDHQKTVAALNARLRTLAGPTGRLRDPNQTGCGGSSSGTTGKDPSDSGDSAKDPAQTTGLFSAGASQLLQRLTGEADGINLAYISCRSYAEIVTKSGQ